MLYSTFTAYLGFKVEWTSIKSWAGAFGRHALEQVRKLIRRTPDGRFALDLDYFEFHTTAERCYSSRFIELFGAPRNPYEPIDFEAAEGQRFRRLCRSVQRVLEDTLVEMARALHQETGLPDLCLGGGVALNGCGQHTHPQGVGLRARIRPAGPERRGMRDGRGLYADRIHFGIQIALYPIIRFGDPQWMDLSWHGSHEKTVSSSRNSRRARSSIGLPTT